ncbi:hypothetical protein GVN18_06600 [Pseudomonas sp. ODNR1LW]|nr:hypothetical protein [Pseudomonas sp. ODNR1LW]
MTVLILSLWSLGILSLIAVAVYRGRRAPAGPVAAPLAAPPAEMSDEEVAELDGKVEAATHALLSQRDSKSGEWKQIATSSSGIGMRYRYGTLEASAEKPIKPGTKGTHVHFPKSGKKSR